VEDRLGVVVIRLCTTIIVVVVVIIIGFLSHVVGKSTILYRRW
jgi:hypothetical protein